MLAIVGILAMPMMPVKASTTQITPNMLESSGLRREILRYCIQLGRYYFAVTSENMEEEISLKKWISIAFLSMVVVWFIWIIAFASGTPWIGILFSVILILIIYLILVLKYKRRDRKR